MWQNLNFNFEPYDWLLIFMVTALGTASAYMKDPQLKAVAATIPIPCGFAYIAVGLPMGAANAISALLCLMYVHVVRIGHNKLHIPIVPAIIIGLASQSGIGRPYKTPLPVYIKAPAIAFVVAGLMVIKRLMGGFCTSFPMMNSIVSYESRYSLGDQCRQLPLFLIAGPIMFIEMRLLETRLGLNHWIVLLCGYILFAFIYWPLNKRLKLKNAKADRAYRHWVRHHG